MHELSVCLALMGQVTQIAARHRARRVEKIVVRVGPLSGIETDQLFRAFPLAAVGTVAESATLVIESCPVRVRCTQCGEETDVEPNRLLCGGCGDYRTRLVSGDEMLLASLELDLEEPPPARPAAPHAEPERPAP